MSVLTRTFTRTHTSVTPANPFLVCLRCGVRVERFHVARTCGCGDDGRLQFFPCEHHGDYADLCPSWSPVDGCTCKRPHKRPESLGG